MSAVGQKRAEVSTGASEAFPAFDAWLPELARQRLERVRDQIENRRRADQLAKSDTSLREILNRLNTLEAHKLKSLQASLDRTLSPYGLKYLDRALASPQLAEDVDRIAASSLFDVDFYLRSVPGLTPDRAIVHFLCFGAALGLDPHPLFSTDFYLAKNVDVQRSGMNPLLHYISSGYLAHRQPHPLFDSEYYLAHNNDVSRSGLDPLAHFLSYGWKEGRDPSADFWIRGYLDKNSDIAAAGVNPLVHFAMHGRSEGRIVPPVPSKAANTLSQSPKKRHFESQPLISVIVPMYNTEPHWAVACVESVLSQSFRNLELILVDDASPRALTRSFMEWFARRDPRVKLVFCETNGGISRATNAGIAAATGDLVAFLDHDDVLREDALSECAFTFDSDPLCDVVYTNHALENEIGEVVHNVSKPAWSPVMFLGVMYLAHLVVVRRSCLEQVGGLDATFDGVQDFELELRLARAARSVKRIDVPLYGWRAVPGSIAAGASNKSLAAPRQIQAVESYLAAAGIEAHVSANKFNEHRVTLEPIGSAELTADVLFLVDDSAGPPSEEFVASLRERTTRKEGVLLLSRLGTHTGRPDFSALDRFLADHESEFVAIVRADVNPGPKNWLSRLALHLSLPKAGMVSPMLVRDRHVASAGRAFLKDGTIINLFAGENPDSDGHIGMLSCAREVSLPSPGACLLRRTDLVSCGPLETWGDLQAAVDQVALKLAARDRSVIHVPSCRFEVDELHPDVAGTNGRALRNLYDASLMDEWIKKAQAGDPYWPT